MKKLVVLALAATIVASLAPAGVNARPAAAPQEETGTVLLPGPGPNGEVTGGCWTGWPRRAWIFSGGATAGPFGSMFKVDPATWNGKFKLEVLSGMSGSEDLDLTFYIDPGKPDPGDPAQQTVTQSTAYLTRKPGGEEGIVPPEATVALICLGIGTGANAEWEYVATPPAKKKKK